MSVAIGAWRSGVAGPASARKGPPIALDARSRRRPRPNGRDRSMSVAIKVWSGPEDLVVNPLGAASRRDGLAFALVAFIRTKEMAA